MDIYYEKISGKVKVLGAFAKIFLVLAIIAGVIFALQQFDILNYYTSYKTYIKYAAIALIVLSILFFIIRKIVNKRKNIRFDGKIIKFCVNNYVEHEFDLKQIDEMFTYRTIPEITYGMQDALAFRFHKNDTWETITSELKNGKKQSSIVLIKDIKAAYAHIKTQRALNQLSSSQGVRFRYLALNSEDNPTTDDYNNTLRKLEETFKNYTNTYGDFNLDRLVITNDSLYHNKYRIASINDSDYIKIRSLHNNNDNYCVSDVIDFYNHKDELIISIDLTLVINADLFKSLCLSVFTEVK